MSAEEERDALAPPTASPPAPPTASPTALYDKVLRLLGDCPDGIPPQGGFSLPSPSQSAAHKKPPSGREAKEALREALSPLPDDADTLHRRFERLGIRYRHRNPIRFAVAELPLPESQFDAARRLARQLVRTSADMPAVLTGLALLARVGEAEDVPHLFRLGLVREFTKPAVHALDNLDSRAAAVVWLTVYADRDELRPLIRTLRAEEGQAIRTELVACPFTHRFVCGAEARRLAEASQLPHLLDQLPSDADLLARAGRLLVRMGCAPDDAHHLLHCHDALGLYDRVVTRAGLLPATLDNAALLLSLALDLSSGTGVLLDWPPGRRATLLDALERLLAEPRWASANLAVAGAPADAPPDASGEATGRRGRRATREPKPRTRANWIRRTRQRPFRLTAEPPGRLRIEVVVNDPAKRQSVQARILVDGRPLIPAAFRIGAALGPAYVLDGGKLRATAEPRTVQLAVADCAEGCCGGFGVTIRHDADDADDADEVGEVVWELRRTLPWSKPDALELGPVLLTHRFDSAAYDAEIARAEADHSWSWPARTLARLIKEGLAEKPELLSRWGLERGRIATDFSDPDVVEMTFLRLPDTESGNPEPPEDIRHHHWRIRDDGTPPEAQAAAVLRRLAEEDPRSRPPQEATAATAQEAPAQEP
ncbi:hypothetical protein HUT18_17520 [Streptomyces sp. NA04227]|uniref:hypothetical protein n=1 Tax=Streptomyces sp. NA04227 TaxID=2742136 RepID=UPI001592558A|nr:hypothetical protein [Streptomyces sp. NA04227]QKW07921.1 hypothetical protein HUT18_17520 [Streptomyces sp. NA04227]